jgi:murein DD-endopeptidase MepM/ murein hydrolase activator NlpD
MRSAARARGRGESGQGLIEYALVLVLIALLVLGSLGLIGTLISDALAMVSEVLGSECRSGLQMVYADQQFSAGEAQAGEISLQWPANGRISQRAWACHHAIDVAAPVGVPVYAAAAGEVVVAGETEYQTLYGHLSAWYVHAGQHVASGQMIGRMGSTGRSTGSHLHFEVSRGSWLLDPMELLP